MKPRRIICHEFARMLNAGSFTVRVRAHHKDDSAGVLCLFSPGRGLGKKATDKVTETNAGRGRRRDLSNAGFEKNTPTSGRPENKPAPTTATSTCSSIARSLNIAGNQARVDSRGPVIRRSPRFQDKTNRRVSALPVWGQGAPVTHRQAAWGRLGRRRSSTRFFRR